MSILTVIDKDTRAASDRARAEAARIGAEVAQINSEAAQALTYTARDVAIAKAGEALVSANNAATSETNALLYSAVSQAAALDALSSMGVEPQFFSNQVGVLPSSSGAVIGTFGAYFTSAFVVQKVEWNGSTWVNIGLPVATIDSIKVNNIAALKLLLAAKENQSINLLGYYNPGDGGGGLFYWDSASTDADNNATVIQVSGITTGRWKRLIADSIHFKWFGALADGIADDSVFVQNAIDYASSNNIKITGSNKDVYLCSFNLKSNLHIDSIGIFKKILGQNQFNAPGNNNDVVQNVRIENTTFDYDSITTGIIANIQVSLQNFTINNCRFVNINTEQSFFTVLSSGTGIVNWAFTNNYIISSTNVSTRHNFFNVTKKIDGFDIIGNTFIGCGGMLSTTSSGYADGTLSRNIRFNDNKLFDTAYTAIQFRHNGNLLTENVEICNNIHIGLLAIPNTHGFAYFGQSATESGGSGVFRNCIIKNNKVKIYGNFNDTDALNISNGAGNTQLVENVVIDSNVFDLSETDIPDPLSKARGIVVFQGSKNITITNNTIRNTGREAIIISLSSDVVIKNNHIENCLLRPNADDGAIRITRNGVVNVIIKDNTLVNCGSSDFSLNAGAIVTHDRESNITISGNNILNSDPSQLQYGIRIGRSFQSPNNSAQNVKVFDNYINGYDIPIFQTCTNTSTNRKYVIKNNKVNDLDIVPLETGSTPNLNSLDNFNTANSSPTLITSLLGGYLGHEVQINGNDGGNTTIVESSSIVTYRGDILLTNGATVRLRKYSQTAWHVITVNDLNLRTKTVVCPHNTVTNLVEISNATGTRLSAFEVFVQFGADRVIGVAKYIVYYISRNYPTIQTELIEVVAPNWKTTNAGNKNIQSATFSIETTTGNGRALAVNFVTTGNESPFDTTARVFITPLSNNYLQLT
jgi:hypothetical protein